MHVSALALLLAQIATILLTARVLGVVIRRLGQPLVVAEITAGIVLGPSVLGWLWPEGLRALFPAASLPILAQLSQLGLVLYMFLVGLEVDLGLLRGRKGAALAISNASIGLPGLLGLAAAVWLHETYAPPGVRLLPFAVFLAVAMSITAFPVLARILSEQNLTTTKVGAIAIACAAVGDITAWFLIPLVVAVARARGYGEVAWTVGPSVAFILFMVYAARPFLRRLGARVTGDTALSSGVMAIVFLGLLISAGATEVLGIHALFGAFLFGAILPKHGALARGLGDRIESIAVILLLPLFFASSGLRTQLGLVSSSHELGVALAILALAIVGKFGGSAIAARLTGSPPREAAAIGVLMNTRGLMELIVLNIGLDLGVISPAIFTMLVMMAVITTVMTAPIVRWLVPSVATHGRRRVARPPAAPAGFAVMTCVAAPDDGERLIAVAAAMTSTSMFVLHLAAPSDRPSEALPAADHPESPVAPLVAHAESMGVRAVGIAFVSEERARDIVATATSHGASLILLGAHKPLLLGHEMGGTVASVFARATQDVAVLEDRGLKKVTRVLYAATADDAAAADIARRFEQAGVTVTTLRADDATREATVLAEAARGYDLLLTPLAKKPIFGTSPISVLVVRRATAAPT